MGPAAAARPVALLPEARMCSCCCALVQELTVACGAHCVAPPSAQALTLPKDWAVLYHTHGLRSFLAVPIGTANETLGLLTVAKQQPHAFGDEW